MRDYSKVSPLFWTGTTGKQIRKMGRDAQVVALYLLTCPSSNMLGLYYLPLPTLCHEVNIKNEGALKTLQRLSEAGFAHYDTASEHVWVVEMARYQIGDTLDEKDNRVKGIKNELKSLCKVVFYNNFLEKYKAVYHLEDVSPYEAPTKPLRSQEQEQEQDTPPPFEEIINYLNAQTGKQYKINSKKTKELITARMNEGFTVDDFKSVIDNQTVKWKNDAKMCEYLRPETLFGTKFESYLNARPNIAQAGMVSNSSLGIMQWAAQKEKELNDEQEGLQKVHGDNDSVERDIRGSIEVHQRI